MENRSTQRIEHATPLPRPPTSLEPRPSARPQPKPRRDNSRTQRTTESVHVAVLVDTICYYLCLLCYLVGSLGRSILTNYPVSRRLVLSPSPSWISDSTPVQSLSVYQTQCSVTDGERSSCEQEKHFNEAPEEYVRATVEGCGLPSTNLACGLP